MRLIKLNHIVLGNDEIFELISGKDALDRPDYYRVKKDSSGTIWEVGSEEKSSRKVVILGLPHAGLKQDLDTLFTSISRIFSGMRLEELVTDRSLQEHKDSRYLENAASYSELRFKNVFGIHSQVVKLAQIILKNPLIKEGFINLNEQIYERVLAKASEYYVYTSLGKHTLEEYLNSNGYDEPEWKELPICIFYLKLFSFLKDSCLARAGLCPSFSLKETAIQKIASAYELPVTEVLETTQESVFKTFQNPLFPDEPANEEELLALVSDEMKRLRTDEDEENLLNQLMQYRKAFLEGNLSKLDMFHSLFPHLLERFRLDPNQPALLDHPTPEDIYQLALKVKQSEEKKLPTLFILPLTSILGSSNLLSILRERGMQVTQLVAKMPKLADARARGLFYRIFSESGEQVGSFLGTVHFADREMLRLNSQIHHDLKNSRAIYLEVDPNEKIDESSNHALQGSIPFTKNSEEKKKLDIFTHRAFFILFQEMKRLSIHSEHLDSIHELYKDSDSEKKLERIEKLIDELSHFIAGTAYEKIVDQLYRMGIDDFLVEYGNVKGKNLFGLERHDEKEKQVAESLTNQRLFASIDQLPTDPSQIEQCILSNLDSKKQLFDLWKAGDEKEIIHFCEQKNASLPSEIYNQIILRRDKKMAENIHQALMNQNGPLFFAVGMGHHGIIPLLRKRGWIAKQV